MRNKVLGMIVLIVGLSLSAQAQITSTWLNATSTTIHTQLWSAAFTTVPNGAGDLAILTGALGGNKVVTNDLATLTLGGLQIGRNAATQARGVTINGNAITFTNSSGSTFIEKVSSPATLAQSDVINTALILGSNLSVSNNHGYGQLSLNGNISEVGSARSVTVSSLSTNLGVVLAGSNTFSGGLTLSSGPLRINNNYALGTGLFTINGGTLQNTAGSNISNANNNAINLAGDFTFASSGNGLDLGRGNVNLGTSNRTITVTGANALTIGGSITNSASLTKAGTNTLTLTGINSYSGGTILNDGILQISGTNTTIGNTTLNAGTLKVGGTQALGTTGSLIVNGSSALGTTAGATISNNITLNANLDVANANNMSIDGNISGNGTLIKSGSASLTLGSANNTYSGGTTLSAGVLQYGVGKLGSGNITMSAGTTLQGGQSAGTLTNNITLLGGVNIGAIQAMTLSGVISGDFGITNKNTATTTLSGDNTFKGDVTLLNTTTLSVSKDANLGAGTNIFHAQNANLSLSGSFTTGKNIILANSGSSQDITVGASQTVTVTGVVSSAGTGGSWRKAGGGTLELGGSNTYNTGLTVIAGKVKIVDAGTLGDGTAGFSLNNGNGDLGGTTQTVGAFSILNGQASSLSNGTLIATSFRNSETAAGVGTVSAVLAGTGAFTHDGAGTGIFAANNTYSGGTLISAGRIQVGNGGTAGTLGSSAVTNNAALVFNRSDVFSVGNVISGTGSLTNIGTGKLTLTANNTYTGATTVAAGTLVVNGSLASSLMTVNDGATLGGTGTVQAVTMDAGSILSAGNSPGTMTFAGNLILSANSTNIMQIFIDGFDVLKGAGTNTIMMAGYTLFDFTGNTVASGSSFTVLTNWAAGGISTNITATFGYDGLAIGQSLDYSKLVSDGLVTVIPEPATIGMLGLGALITLLIRRVRTV